MQNTDDEFYDRADAFIGLANQQISKEITRGKVSASFMYALSRFNSYVSATGFESKAEMENSKQETMDYFLKEYKKMLEENLDDYISNFDEYMNISAKK